jgi:hypothetical protein
MQIEQTQARKFSTKISQALGQQKLQTLSQRQAAHLNQALARLLERKSVDQISEAEIQGQYDLVVDHLSPAAYEVRRQN